MKTLIATIALFAAPAAQANFLEGLKLDIEFEDGELEVEIDLCDKRKEGGGSSLEICTGVEYEKSI